MLYPYASGSSCSGLCTEVSAQSNYTSKTLMTSLSSWTISAMGLSQLTLSMPTLVLTHRALTISPGGVPHSGLVLQPSSALTTSFHVLLRVWAATISALPSYNSAPATTASLYPLPFQICHGGNKEMEAIRPSK